MNLVLILPRERDILLQRRFKLAEDKAVIMHALDSDVFYYLCAKTDWATGRIGERSKLSYARIAATLSEDIPRKPKRSLRRVTRKCVHNSVKRLIKAGLLISASISELEKNRLVLDRPLWLAVLATHHSSTNADRRQLDALFSEFERIKVIKNSHLESGLTKGNTDQSACRYPADGTYQYNNISNTASDQKSSMTLNWQADKKYVDHFLKASGFSGSQIKKIWFGKYVQYWSQQETCRTQREWSAHFANHMQGYLLKPNFFEEVNGLLEDIEPSTAMLHRTKKSKSDTKRLTVPMMSDGAKLQAWAVARGLPTAPAGANTAAYHRLLCHQVEKRNNAQDRVHG